MGQQLKALSKEEVMNLQAKDILTLVVSLCSAIIAVISLIITYRQRQVEDKRNIRSSLTDTLTSLTEVNIAMVKLKLENKTINDDVFAFRRGYNSQRRYLANHAEFLSQQIPDLVSDIDHNMIAHAFSAMGDYERAFKHWEVCIAKSPAPPVLATNLRGFAGFLFEQGNPQLGRKNFEKSVQVAMPDSDVNRRLRADTFAIWSITERDFGFLDHAKRRKEQAEAEARRIGHEKMRKDIQAYIESLWAETSQTVNPEPASPNAESTGARH
jgi:tetratricopeptide (TPR) repeat protein